MPIINPTKICTSCKQEKPIVEFGVNRASKDGLHYWCKLCNCAKKKEQDQKDRSDPIRLARRRATNNAWNKPRSKKRNLWFFYGLTEEEFNERVRQQNGVCAMCGQPETRMVGGTLCSLSVDHSHKFHKKDRRGHRGLLCSLCNAMLGHFKDDPVRMLAAIAYLKNTKEIKR